MPSFLHVESRFNWLPQELSITMISRTKIDTDFSTVSESARKEGSLISALGFFFSSADHDTTVDTWMHCCKQDLRSWVKTRATISWPKLCDFKAEPKAGQDQDITNKCQRLMLTCSACLYHLWTYHLHRCCLPTGRTNSDVQNAGIWGKEGRQRKDFSLGLRCNDGSWWIICD